jgi:hypothetical protein
VNDWPGLLAMLADGVINLIDISPEIKNEMKLPYRLQ